jgi:hypothetical protein
VHVRSIYHGANGKDSDLLRRHPRVSVMDGWTISASIAAAGFFLNLGWRIFGGAWNLSTNLTTVKTELLESIAAMRRDFEDSQNTARKEFGDTAASLREHIRQVEFHIRDYYIRKDDFGTHMQSHDELLRTNFENIGLRLARIEKTLDEKPKS